MSSFQYLKLNDISINQDVLLKFNCGHPDFNDFLINDAIECGNSGDGVTYILVNNDEFEKGNISAIFAFATIRATSLYYQDEQICSISSAEIKYFAIDKKFQKQKAILIDPDKYYSTIFFELLLIDLYEMSVKTIGFKSIFLRANECGEKLYRRKNFIEASSYIIPYEEDDPLGKCIPMCLVISDNIYSIFGID